MASALYVKAADNEFPSSAAFILVAVGPVGLYAGRWPEQIEKIPIEEADARALFSDLRDRRGADSSLSNRRCTRLLRPQLGDLVRHEICRRARREIPLG